MEWISVKDRLPSPIQPKETCELEVVFSQPLLVCDDSFEMYTAELIVINKDTFKWRCFGCCFNEHVAKPTHWMLLPELPEEEE